MARRASDRETARESGRTPKNPIPGPDMAKGAGGHVLKRREEARRTFADTEKHGRRAIGRLIPFGS